MEQTKSSVPQSTSSFRLSWLLVSWLAPTRIPRTCKEILVVLGWRQTEIVSHSSRWRSGCRDNALLGQASSSGGSQEAGKAAVQVKQRFTGEEPTLQRMLSAGSLPEKPPRQHSHLGALVGLVVSTEPGATRQLQDSLQQTGEGRDVPAGKCVRAGLEMIAHRHSPALITEIFTL